MDKGQFLKYRYFSYMHIMFMLSGHNIMTYSTFISIQAPSYLHVIYRLFKFLQTPALPVLGVIN